MTGAGTLLGHTELINAPRGSYLFYWERVVKGCGPVFFTGSGGGAKMGSKFILARKDQNETFLMIDHNAWIPIAQTPLLTTLLYKGATIFTRRG